ncbi:MAG TPA: methylated-DNA--[protein]-cysteine S-methyltransferase [Stellaceae bacterium]|nr:methylated-DNA--[protein]-cysteine S-methyltransferase [Stellaceae bacterium]
MPEITVPSPLGLLAIEERDGALVALHWRRARKEEPTPLLQRAAEQLAEYFARTRREFDLPMKPAGSVFERAVWDAMLRIPYGQTRSYGELANEIGGAARAVGAACGTNPLPILIPCHRVLAGGGRLGGYSGKGGGETKTMLLTLEGALLV